MWQTMLGLVILGGLIYLVVKMRRKPELDWLTGAKREGREETLEEVLDDNLRKRRRQ